MNTQIRRVLGLGRIHFHGADLGFQFQHRLFQLGEIHGLIGGCIFHGASGEGGRSQCSRTVPGARARP